MRNNFGKKIIRLSHDLNTIAIDDDSFYVSAGKPHSLFPRMSCYGDSFLFHLIMRIFEHIVFYLDFALDLLFVLLFEFIICNKKT